MMYKVVRVLRDPETLLDRYFSSIVLEKPFLLEYFVGKWVYPVVPNSRLFVFKDIEDAVNFTVSTLTKEYIFSCRVIEPVKQKFTANITPKVMKKFWKGDAMHRSELSKAPPGTYSVRGINLLERVF